MRKEYLIDFLNTFHFPEGAKVSILKTYEDLEKSTQMHVFCDCIADYKSEKCNYDEGIQRIKTLAERISVHEYALILLYLIFLADILKERYQSCGIDERVWFDSVSDLKYKALDCEGLFGVWGTKDESWHKGFFEMKKFGFGKLQFQPKSFDAKYEKNGLKLQEDSPVIYVHIPRTGEKLDYDEAQRSYAQATDFFKKYFFEAYADKAVAFVFRSWMLFEKHKQIMKSTSNFMRFCNDYDVFQYGEYPDYTNVWRVFYRFYEGDVSKMPTDTSLQRAYVEIIKNNEKIGWGWGVYAPSLQECK